MKYKIAKKVFAKEWEEINLETGKKEILKSYTYKFFIKGKGYWISDSLVFNNLLDIEDDNLILKEPIEKYYSIEERENKNGTFNVVTINNGNYNTLVNKLKTEDNTTSISLEEFDKIQLPRKKAFLDRAETEKVVNSHKKELSADTKFLFMKTLLEKSSDKKMNENSRQKLLTLIAKELESKSSVTNEELLKEIKEIKALLNDKSNNIISIPDISKIQKLKNRIEDFRNSTIDQDEEDLNQVEEISFDLKQEKKISEKQKKHQPKKIVEILKQFKYTQKNKIFKELVHQPYNPDEYTIDNFKESILDSQKYFDEFYDIPIDMYKNIEELMNLMQNEGLKYYEEYSMHPFGIHNESIVEKNKYPNLQKNNLVSYTPIIQFFKKNYRFDYDNSESSILKDLIDNVITYKEHNHSEDNSIYVFENSKNTTLANYNEVYKLKTTYGDKFNDFASFFTWVPSVKNIIRTITADILKHGNINGFRNFNSEKKEVSFELKRYYDDQSNSTKIELQILDVGTVSQKQPDILLQQLQEKTHLFLSICDWSVEYDTEKSSFKINLLPNNEILPIETKVGGFKHILTFYD